MAYNTGFPATYQPIYYPQYTPPQQMQQPISPVQQPASNSIIWVQGEAGAKSYLVAPNSTVQLWDSESQRIFLKSADASGMPSIKTLEYTIRDARPANAPAIPDQSVEYVTRDELKALYGRLESIQSELEGLTAKPPVSAGKNRSKESAENE